MAKEALGMVETRGLTAAIEAGKAHGAPLGQVYGAEIIPSPSEEVKKFFDFEHITEQFIIERKL